MRPLGKEEEHQEDVVFVPENTNRECREPRQESDQQDTSESLLAVADSIVLWGDFLIDLAHSTRATDGVQGFKSQTEIG